MGVEWTPSRRATAVLYTIAAIVFLLTALVGDTLERARSAGTCRPRSARIWPRR